MSQKQKVTLITGTRKGIGKHLANHYANLGHKVIGCSRSPTDWEHKNYEHHQLDISDENAAKELFKDIQTKHGSLDHLINNAGVASMNHSILTPLSSLRQILETNVVGTFLFCREAAKLMQKNKFGRIINFSTVAVPLKLEGEAAYVCSKAGVISLSEILARELAEFGITVNIIGPTPMETDLIGSVPKEKIEKILKRQAIHRMASFEDVANITDFFLKAESNLITGQTLFLGGV